MKIKKTFLIEPDEQANEITEAFGIDSGYENKVVDIELPDDFEIMYITGESGSGKSTILKELATIPDIEIPNTHLFEWGDKQKETLRILTLVGLGDAVLFLSKYNQLSDSQQARARISLQLINDLDVLVVDEFLSTLDRETAKSVAYCIQKVVRKMGKKAIFVTAHNDLENYLKPDVLITGKAFPSAWEVENKKVTDKNEILGRCTFEYKDKFFYKELRLGELHYKGKYTGGTKEYLAVMLEKRCIGILVSTYRRHDGGRRISRVVIHPSYRGVGIGKELISKYLEDYPKCDVVAAMAMFNPVFEKAGMKRTTDSKATSPSGMKKQLIEKGFNAEMWFSKDYCNLFSLKEENRIVISGFAKNATHLVQPGGKHLRTDEIKQKIIDDKVTASRVLWGLRPRTMAKFIG